MGVSAPFRSLMGEVIDLPMWVGIQEEDLLHCCPECYSDKFQLMVDGRPVCAECETLITNLKIITTD